MKGIIQIQAVKCVLAYTFISFYSESKHFDITSKSQILITYNMFSHYILLTFKIQNFNVCTNHLLNT